ncbi:SIR2 family protein [Sphingomonas sp. Leaf21]|uniref:SIR2 family protein n=1 Tax=Sphingomonas sp. Leaf21 TaxID=2876550 RepID=UPI001E2FF6D2|nr:SIR2 family protein [Sphingomonas sp. Leaf21]
MTAVTDKPVARFIERYLAEIEAGNAALFAGAGLSAPAGFVDWRELLRDIADELDLRIDWEHDLIAVAQFHLNKTKNRHRLNQAIIDALSSTPAPTANHRRLARLPIRTWWTTNYDGLIERALEDAGKIVDVKSAVSQLANTRRGRDAVLYKMHGDVSRPDEAVVTRNDYERYALDRGPFVSALTGDLLSKTFLFVGFSFTDPNLEQVLARLRLHVGVNQREHFAFLRRRTRLANESDDEFAHNLARHRLMVDDLQRFNVQVILVDEYADVELILAEIERRHRRQTAFVSASADDFEPWGRPAVENFMRRLGHAIVAKDARLLTGLGLGVGNALFTGAVERVLEGGRGRIEDTLILRPFPQHIDDQARRERVWEDYRQRIIPDAGVALFLFGNKRAGDEIVLANGMVREWEIALQHGLTLVPIGATGSTARDLAAQALADPDRLLAGLDQGQRDIVARLAEPVADLAELIEPIARLIADLRGGR